MLSYGKSPECSVKGSSSLGHQRLLQQEREIHLPYARHFVEQYNCSFKKRIDLEILCSVDGWISSSKVLDPEFEIL